MDESVESVARTAESSRVFRVLARCGFAANGVIHVLIGVIALVLAFGGEADADQTGALRALAAAPWGFAALWAIAIGMWSLGAWHLTDGVLARHPRRRKRWPRRISAWGQTVAYVAIGALAAAVALGARPDAEETAEAASEGALSIPGGAIVLGAVGAGVGIAGATFVVMGLRRSFMKKMSVPDGALGATVTTLGAVGFVAKGIALGIVGVLLIVAAVTIDPDAAGGLDGALTALLGLAYGPWLVGAVGAGLIAYGVFCFFRARYARLRPAGQTGGR